MQRLFSMFPRGLPGLALLLLRISVLVSVLFSVCGHLTELSSWLVVGSFVVAASLFAGFLTPFAALLALAVNIAISVSSNLGLQGVGYITVSILDALALSMLGPGSYSIDAYRFGRRVIDLPPPGDRGPF